MFHTGLLWRRNGRHMSESAFDYSDQVVIVTGGCRGVGRGITQSFRAVGARVVSCCRHAPADHVEELIGVEFIATDVRDAEQVDRAVGAVMDRFGRLDVLVNNAGGAPPADAATASPRFSNAILQLNLLAPLYFA